MSSNSQTIARNSAVVLCDCGSALRQRLDFEWLEKQLAQDPSVAEVAMCSHFCDTTKCSATIKALYKTGARRLVVAACDPQVFRDQLTRAGSSNGFADGLWWPVNIREHCGYVTADKKTATQKAFDMIKAALRRLAQSEPVKSIELDINQDVLVVGGGVAGMQTALALGQLGHRVCLLDKADKLGGLVASQPQFYGYLADGPAEATATAVRVVTYLIEQLNNSRKVTVHTKTRLLSVQGQFGNFSATASSNGSRQQLAAGALVLASNPCGSFPFGRFGLGNPFTTVDMARLYERMEMGEIPSRVAIVLDVLGQHGRAVSAQALSAAELLASRFGARVKLLASSIRVAADGLEALYRRVRRAGAVVVKFDTPPVITENARKVTITYQDPTAGAEITEDFDLLVMADAAPAKDAFAGVISQLRRGPQALQCDNVWLVPIETNRKGIYVVGSAAGNSELRQALAEGLAAANHIHSALASKQIELSDDAAAVDGHKCVLCLTCLRICPHGAVSIDTVNKAAAVSAVACRRCGTCAAECPAGAIQLPRYTDLQTGAELSNGQVAGRIVIFACENSALTAASAAGLAGSEYNHQVRLIRVPCAGKVDARQILAVLAGGAAKVKVLGCHPESCRYLTGSSRAEKRIQRIGQLLEKCGLDKSRVFFGGLAALEPARFLQLVEE